MAKFIKTFENGIIENRLVFRGKEFTITMIPNDTGAVSKEKGMDIQLPLAFPDDEHIGEIAELADQLWYAAEDEVLEILEQLDEDEL